MTDCFDYRDGKLIPLNEQLPCEGELDGTGYSVFQRLEIDYNHLNLIYSSKNSWIFDLDTIDGRSFLVRVFDPADYIRFVRDYVNPLLEFQKTCRDEAEKDDQS